VERGRDAYDFAEGDVGAAVSRAVQVLRYRAERESMELDVHIDENLPPARIDDRAIQLAVMNLVDNAIKYASGGKVVRVSVKDAPQGIEIQVTDEGPGIPAEERTRIFERFVSTRQ